MAGQNDQAGGAKPPHAAGDESDLDLLALLGQSAPGGATGRQQLEPAAVSRILAALVEQNLPAGIVVITQDELDRTRERAYADGWQDALRYAWQRQQPAGTTGPGSEFGRTGQHNDSRAAEPTTAIVPPAPREPTSPRTGTEATVLAFPPRIPLVRAADTARQQELMPHRPRRRRRTPPKPAPDQPGN
ncbi:hypothetical protein P3T36_003200 [Kitasatospora sp. MAP12-15]|uniref:hypothetical protein n=1 Tax=unclassified Kitasatospora TaxID=2633591 RepID=UPI002473E7F8|nr:hypothetical protein [Kitasatospora sp. MAP12-44]MDH6111176.1 hypothetical protein [Kitasatospora sp. MAP12-44]